MPRVRSRSPLRGRRQDPKCRTQHSPEAWSDALAAWSDGESAATPAKRSRASRSSSSRSASRSRRASPVGPAPKSAEIWSQQIESWSNGEYDEDPTITPETPRKQRARPRHSSSRNRRELAPSPTVNSQEIWSEQLASWSNDEDDDEGWDQTNGQGEPRETPGGVGFLENIQYLFIILFVTIYGLTLGLSGAPTL